MRSGPVRTGAQTVPIEAVPLRRREEDIPGLGAPYLRQAARTLKRACPTLTQAGVLQLLNYDWPGNVRELQNVIERAVITFGSGPLRGLVGVERRVYHQ